MSSADDGRGEDPRWPLPDPSQTAGGLPRLVDRSREGRAAYAREHGHMLWAIWRDLLADLVEDGRLDLRPALSQEERAATPSAWERAGLVAERILEKFASDETLDVPSWTHVEAWYGVLVGAQAARASRPPRAGEDAEQRIANRRHPVNVPAAIEDGEIRRLLLALVDEWQRVLATMVATTRRREMELYWLWATVAERKPLADWLSDMDVPVAADRRWTEQDGDALASETPTCGNEPKDRTARTRSGAGACFRFNLATLRADPQRREETERVAVSFLAEAEDKPPFKPRQPLGDGGVSEFETVLRWTAESQMEPDRDDPAGILRARVLRCALVKAVARQLPRRLGDDIEARWTQLTREAGGEA